MWFNAWQYEREEEPLVPLLLAIQEALAENVEAHQGFFERAAPAVWKRIKKLPRVFGDVALGFKFKTAFWLQVVTGIEGEVEVEVEPGKIVEGLRETFEATEKTGPFEQDRKDPALRSFSISSVRI